MYTYIMSNELNLIKVGRSRNPNNRAKTIESYSGVKTVVEYMVEGEHLEHILHNKLSEYRSVGEWFSCTVEFAVKTLKACDKEYNDKMSKNVEVIKDISKSDPEVNMDIINMVGKPVSMLTKKEKEYIEKYMLERLLEEVGGVTYLSKMLNLPFTTVQGWKERNRISKGGARLVESHITLGENYTAIALRPDL